MGDTYNVFISWSGERSKAAAEALRGWLRSVLQAARPWMSSTDIEKGSRGLEEVGRALEGIKVGIICLTPENLAEPWILFEAGALSKTLDAKTRVCTYLLGGLQPENMTAPLSMFQWTRAEREDTRKLLHAVNKALDGSPVPENNLDDLFEGMWPRLEKQLATLPPARGAAVPPRSEREMLAEVLELARVGANSNAESTAMMTALLGAVGSFFNRLMERQVPILGGPPTSSYFEQSNVSPGSFKVNSVLGFRDVNPYAAPPLTGKLSDLVEARSSTTVGASAGKNTPVLREDDGKQKQHHMHAPGKRAGERGKTGGEKT